MPSQSAIEPMFAAIDPTDVAPVSVRELATALKVLSEDGRALERAADWTEDDFRRVEQVFWQRCGRDRQRKVAALVRLRCLVEVCRARAMRNLMAEHGAACVAAILATAATMRLNIAVGFSPVKLGCAVRDALSSQDESAMGAAA